jgi:hypothetical protein
MIDLIMSTQPDDETCGPTCLHAIYGYYGHHKDLDTLIQSTERSISGGTLTPMLAKHAATHGFKTTLYVNNVEIFDPTWFEQGAASNTTLIDKLETQIKYKKSNRMTQSSHAYLDYLRLGGTVRFETININLLKHYFKQKIPVLTALSATYLYRSARERFTNDGTSYYDDIQGTPCGHFVVLCGYDETHRHIVVADPHRQNPLSHDNYYKVSSNRLINAIMLGVLTYDAHLLIIQPKEEPDANDFGHG